MSNKVLIIPLLLMIACSSPRSEKELSNKTKKEEVIQIHDVAMERMGEIVKLKSELKQKLSSDSTQQDKIQAALLKLEEADDLMWKWMRAYNSNFVDTANTDTVALYLEKELEKVKVVQQKINSSIQNAQDIL